MAAMRSVGVRLRLYVDKYKQEAQEAARANEHLGDSGKKAKASLDGMAMTMGLLGGAMLAAAAVAVVTAAKFDKQMSEVGAVAGATAEEFGQLRQAALDAGAATAFSASQAAEAEAELAKAGVKTSDILGGALTGALALASAGTLDLATAATISANAMNTFGLKGKDVGHIGDVLAAAANKSAVGVEDLGLGLQQVGLVANQVGLSLEETVALLAAFGDRGLRGSDGATSLKTALLRLAAPLGEARALMDQYGISLYDSNGHMVDAATIAGQLRTGLGNLDDETRNAALATIFGSDAIRAANVLYGLGRDGVQDYVDAVNQQGAAQDVASEKMNNLSGDVTILRSQLESLFITAADGSTGPMRWLVQALSGIVSGISSLPPWLTQTTLLLGGVTGATLLLVAATLKARAGLANMNAQLVAMGPAGVKAAAGLRAVTAAAGWIGLALAAATLAIEAFNNRAGIIGKIGGDIFSSVDEKATEMVKSGHTVDAIKAVQAAATQLGITYSELAAKLPGYQQAIRDAGEATEGQGSAALDASQYTLALGGAFGNAAAEADGLLGAFERLNGGVLGWREAEREAEAAADDLVDALKASNGSLDVHDEKGRAAAAAVDDLAKKAAEAAQAKYDETASVSEANRVYQEYIDRLHDILVGAGMSETEVQKLINQIAQMPTYKSVTIEAKVRLKLSSLGIGDLAGGSYIEREGGIVHAAAGMSRTQAQIRTQPTVWFAEPETGGEAYVPRKGNYSRSMAILGEAAGWYGAQVVPNGGYSTASTATAPAVNLQVSWAGGGNGRIEQAILDGLRFQTDQFGAGNVQGFVGSQGRR